MEFNIVEEMFFILLISMIILTVLTPMIWFLIGFIFGEIKNLDVILRALVLGVINSTLLYYFIK